MEIFREGTRLYIILSVEKEQIMITRRRMNSPQVSYDVDIQRVNPSDQDTLLGVHLYEDIGKKEWRKFRNRLKTADTSDLEQWCHHIEPNLSSNDFYDSFRYIDILNEAKESYFLDELAEELGRQ